jgi:hypothetical protein
LLVNELAAFNPLDGQEKRLAQRAGLALDTMLSELNRWGDDSLGATFSRKVSDAVMRASAD